MDLTGAHWVYLAGIVLLIALVVMKKNVVAPAIIATFVTATVMTGDFTTGIGAIFRASISATTQLLTIFLVIAIMASLVQALRAAGAAERMITPFQRLMRNGPTAYVVMAVITFGLSLVFWPTSIIPLLAATLIPAALRVGLSPVGAAVAIAIAGQGMALSSDYILGVASSLSAEGAGVPASDIATRALVIALIVGVVALAAAYFMTVRKTIARSSEVRTRPRVMVGSSSGGSGSGSDAGESEAVNNELDMGHDAPREEISERRSRMLSLLIPVSFGALLVFILLGRFTSVVPKLPAGEGATLVGGATALLLVLITRLSAGSEWLERSADHFVHGLSFAFRVMGMVIPVAGFIYIGLDSFSGEILGLPEDATAPSLLLDVVAQVQEHIPSNSFVSLFTMLFIGMMLGLDGSGWPGLPFTGTLATAIGNETSMDPALLAAVAQNGATWVGGGTLVIWSSLIAVAGVTGVSVIRLARMLFLPVVGGLILATLAAGLIW